MKMMRKCIRHLLSMQSEFCNCRTVKGGSEELVTWHGVEAVSDLVRIGLPSLATPVDCCGAK